METSMLTHPTHERLIIGLSGMAKALEEQRRSPDLDALSFEERVGLLVDREAAERDTKRLTTRLKFAALRQSACVEDLDWRTPRGIDRAVFARLIGGDWIDRNENLLITGATGLGKSVEDLDWRTPRGIDRAVFARLIGGDWIDRNENLLITGATGLGKSWIACALGHKACRDNRSVQYHRAPRLFEALALARGDGRYGRLLKTFGRVQLLILDDWGLSVLNPSERRDLLEILDDRHGRASTIVTSQIPVEHWHEIIGDPTLGDAILDRLVHNAHRLQLTGESMRKQHARNQTLDANSNA
jgi:DNA replication protein DnaC